MATQDSYTVQSYLTYEPEVVNVSSNNPPQAPENAGIPEDLQIMGIMVKGESLSYINPKHITGLLSQDGQLISVSSGAMQEDQAELGGLVPMQDGHVGMGGSVAMQSQVALGGPIPMQEHQGSLGTPHMVKVQGKLYEEVTVWAGTAKGGQEITFRFSKPGDHYYVLKLVTPVERNLAEEAKKEEMKLKKKMYARQYRKNKKKEERERKAKLSKYKAMLGRPMQ